MKLTQKILIFFLIVILFSLACKKNTNDKLNITSNPYGQSIDFSEQENDYLLQIYRRGYITIATRERETVYEPNLNGDGLHGGIEYLTAKSFADYIGVKLKIITVPTVKDYFAYKSTIPDAGVEAGLIDGTYVPYTPDIMSHADIIVDGLSSQRWRMFLLRFIQTFPDKDVILARQNISINTLEDLQRHKIAVVPLAAYTTTLKRIEDHLKLKFEYVTVSDTPDLPRAVSVGEADIAAFGGFPSLISMKRYNNIKIALPLSTSEASWSHWAVKLDNEILASILQKYLTYAKKNGIIDNIWIKSLGISYTEFTNIIRLM